MVEQEAVNFEVTGSSPVRGAIEKSRTSVRDFSIRISRTGQSYIPYNSQYSIVPLPIGSKNTASSSLKTRINTCII